MSVRVSVVVPFIQEFPQNLFTLRALHEELKGIPHEIIAVDNFCDEVLLQLWGLGRRSLPEFLALNEDEREELYQHQIAHKLTTPIDRGHDRPKGREAQNPPRIGDAAAIDDKSHIAALADRNDWLRYMHYSKKLSHWQAKNLACREAKGDLLIFADAHTSPARGSLSGMVNAYDRLTEEHGPCSLHAPLSYHILEDHRLIYKLVWKPETNELHYSFTGYRDAEEPYEVDCMSTCGMLISREVYDLLGGWPAELGIYGGGENFTNFASAVLGVKKFIMPGPALHHHGEKRGYHWNFADHKRNQAIAAFCYGGEAWLQAFCRKHVKYERVPAFFEHLIETIPAECAEHRAHIQRNQKQEIEAWIAERTLSI